MEACPVLVAKYACEYLKELLAREVRAEVPSSKELIYLFCLLNSCVLLPLPPLFRSGPRQVWKRCGGARCAAGAAPQPVRHRAKLSCTPSTVVLV